MYKKILLFILCVILFTTSFSQNNSISKETQEEFVQRQKDLIFERNKQARENFLANLDKINSDSVFVLNISQLAFREFPDIERFTNITKIIAWHNQLVYVNIKRKNLKSVTSINFSGNDIKNIKIGYAPSLERINFVGNNISKLPVRLVFSRKLESILLNDCHIVRLPWWLKYKKSITEMCFSGEEFLIDSKNFRRMRNLTLLQIIGHPMDSLPDELCEMVNLEKLVVARTRLKIIPKDFDKLKNLKVIIFYEDDFDEIPKSCFNLPRLKHLDFYFNNISYIPNEIENCDSLQELFLSFNKISVLPDAISKMHNLNSLYIHHNNIEFVPDWINNMDSLKILDMGYNDISELPSLSKLYKLQSIDFQENNIETFPTEWFLLPKLNVIYMFNNPLKFSKEEHLLFTEGKNSFNKDKGHLFYGDNDGAVSNMKTIKTKG